MTTTLVKNPGGRTYQVKNFDWLFRHVRRSKVVRVEAIQAASDEPEGKYWMAVEFDDGYKFFNVFNDPVELMDFLYKYLRLGVAPVLWNGITLPDVWWTDYYNLLEHHKVTREWLLHHLGGLYKWRK